MSPVRARSAVTYEFDGASGCLSQYGQDQSVFFPWPTMKAVRNTAAGRRPSRRKPELEIGRASSDPAVARYLDSVPREVVAEAERYPDRHWQLLVFMARCGDAALDLLRANPALGYMLASNQDFHRVHLTSPMVAARLLLGLGRRQREILDWLEFPATEAVRRITRKIDHAAVAIAPLRALRAHLGAPECQKRLAHLPHITRPVLQAAAAGTITCIAPPLLRQLTEGRVPRAAGLPRLLDDTVRMWRAARPGVPLPTFHSTRRIVEEHHRLATTVNWLELEKTKGDLPDPPLAGTDAIVPITSTSVLCDEGADQRNCVASYAPQIRQKRVFVYRVLAPSRATLSIVRRQGRWQIDQLEAACNRPAPRETRLAVLAWLRTAPDMSDAVA